jgi:hypothetical protein
MKNKAILFGASALILGGVILAPKMVEAYRGDPNIQGPNFTQERHEAMTQAFENNDFGAWEELMQGKGRVKDVINEGNFARFAEAHKLMLEGKTDEASQIRAELGLGQKNGSGQGQCGEGQGRGQGRNR